MELGNLMFGNSRGEFSIDRGQGFEHQLTRLFNALKLPHQTIFDTAHGVDFENNTFHTFIYYWGDCSCGYEERREAAYAEWSKTNKHADNCYQTALRTRLASYDRDIGYKSYDSFEDLFFVDGAPLIINTQSIGESLLWTPRPHNTKLYELHQKFEFDLMTELCAAYGLDRNFGAAVHCTCGYDKLYAEWEAQDDHNERCLLLRPNFLFKPTGFTMNWYKYPLRDAYMSERITLPQFVDIIDQCIVSLAEGSLLTPTSVQ